MILRTALTKNLYSWLRDVLGGAFAFATGDIGEAVGDGSLRKMFSQEKDPTFTSIMNIISFIMMIFAKYCTLTFTFQLLQKDIAIHNSGMFIFHPKYPKLSLYDIINLLFNVCLLCIPILLKNSPDRRYVSSQH
jgi:hypothetical protein